MTELVTTTATDLDVNHSAQEIARLTQAIEEITTVEQASEASAVVRGIHAYAEAQRSIELVNQAVELRIWAERKGGEAIVTNGHKLSTLHKHHRINPTTARRWVTLYLMDIQFIRDYIAETRANGRQLSVDHLITRGREAFRKRVAPGVFKEIGGRYTIEWKEGGVKRTHGGIATKETAVHKREQMIRLAPVRELARKKVEQKAAASVVYGYVRRALDACRTRTGDDAVKEAMEHLYRAEDVLAKGMRQVANDQH